MVKWAITKMRPTKSSVSTISRIRCARCIADIWLAGRDPICRTSHSFHLPLAPRRCMPAALAPTPAVSDACKLALDARKNARIIANPLQRRHRPDYQLGLAHDHLSRDWPAKEARVLAIDAVIAQHEILVLVELERGEHTRILVLARRHGADVRLFELDVVHVDGIGCDGHRITRNGDDALVGSGIR